MSKIERLLNLTAALLDSSRPLTAKELRTKIEGYPSNDDNFMRMFERDKEDLRSMGVPLEVKTSYAGEAATDGYLISTDDYYLADLDLTEDELSAVNLALLSIQLDGEDAHEALWKVGGVTQSQEPSSQTATIEISPELTKLFSAVTSKKVVAFEYNDAQRQVSPWRLDLKRGRWYLIGFDHTKEAERNFRLDRIADSGVEVTDEDAVPAPQAEVRDKKPWQYGDSPETVSLWVSKERERFVAAQLGASALSSKQGQSEGTVFEVEVAEFEPFRNFCIDLLDQAEILGPESVRQSFASWLGELEARYV